MMREAYRLQKNLLKEKMTLNGKTLFLFIIFVGNTLHDFDTIFQKTGEILRQLELKSDDVSGKRNSL
jgi:hypothetical protein